MIRVGGNTGQKWGKEVLESEGSSQVGWWEGSLRWENLCGKVLE